MPPVTSGRSAPPTDCWCDAPAPPSKTLSELRKDAIAALCLMEAVWIGTVIVMTVIH